MKKSLFLSSLVVTALFAASACAEKSEAKNEPKTAPAAEAKEATPTAKPHPALDRYEEVRKLLAADQIADAVKAASTLAHVAEQIAKTAPESAKPHLEAMAKAAKELSTKDAGNADDVRKQYGEVSRAALALLAAEPSLAEGRYAFECPMAQGYKKWVQLSSEMANPYMGKRMLKCGSKSEMKL